MVAVPSFSRDFIDEKPMNLGLGRHGDVPRPTCHSDKCLAPCSRSFHVVAKIWPDAEHRFCVRHMYQNFHKLHKGEQLKNNLWATARAINNPTYIKAMENMKADSVGAYRWVEKWSPRTWIKAFFNPFPKYDILLNNMSEVFNRLGCNILMCFNCNMPILVCNMPMS